MAEEQLAGLRASLRDLQLDAGILQSAEKDELEATLQMDTLRASVEQLNIKTDGNLTDVGRKISRRKFSEVERDARRNFVVGPNFGRNFGEIELEMQRTTLPKFHFEFDF